VTAVGTGEGRDGGRQDSNGASSGTDRTSGPFEGLWRVLRRLRLHKVVTTLSALVVGMGVLVGLTDGTLSLIDRMFARGGGPVSETTANPAPAPSTTTPGVRPEPSVTPTPVSIGVGTCLTEDLAPVDCGALHRFEVMTTDDAACTTPTVIDYMGGRTGTDVVLASAELVQPSTGGEEVCAVRGAGGPTSESAADALQRGAGSRWRWCIDTRSGRDVPCDVPHQAEYVGVDVPAPDVEACQAAAERYLEASFDRVADRLQLSLSPVGSTPSLRPPCVVVARGSAVLTDSIRGVGARALPLEQV
jgi:hypothetical protein